MAEDLVCVQGESGWSNSVKDCSKHKCVRLCGEPKTLEELNQQISLNSITAVICRLEEKCVEEKQTHMCKGSVSKEKVLADLSSLKRLSRLINETETNSESLMQREFCAKNPYISGCGCEESGRCVAG